MERNPNTSYRRSGYYNRKPASEWPHILLFYVLPFLVFNSILFYCAINKPKLSVNVADTNDYLTTEITLTVNSWFPVKSVTMTMDGEELELVKGKKRTYTTTVSKNGSIEARVVNLNGMPANTFEHVNVLDDNPPAFEQAEILDGVVTLTLSDSQSGVNFDSIYAVNSTGEQITPLTVDRSTNTLTYEMDSAGLSVYAQDKAGNEVQGAFTSHKEGDVETLEGGASGLEDGEAGISGEAAGGSQDAGAASSPEADEEQQITIQ